MRLRNFLVASTIAALCCLSGCSPIHTFKEVTRRSQLQQNGEKGTLVVVTRDGSEYWLTAFELKDSTLGGVGEQTAPVHKEFAGHFSLDSIECLYLREGGFFKSMVFVGLAVSAISLGANALLDKKGLSANDVISYPPMKSCPYVYAFDGTGFKFSSETFAGSIFRGAERTVIDRIDALKPVNGSYVLKLTNERMETDYVNELTVSVVDAPEDVEVLASDDGVFHTLKSTVPPISCMDQDSVSVLDDVQAADGMFWEVRKRERFSVETSGYVDRLEAEFHLRKDNGSVKLLVSGRNTELAAFAFDRISALCGSGYARWIYRLEHDPAQGKSLRRFLLREGLLHVYVWNGTDWQAAGVIMDSGAELVKDHILVVPVPLRAQGVLRVRLECTADLWRIDRLAVDESEDVDVTCTSLAATGLSGSAGEDALPLLATRDDRYLIAMPGDSVVLSFAVPVSATGLKRTCFVKATGYYHHWSTFAGEDNTREVNNILEIPGYGARAYLPLWFAREAGGGF